MKQQILTMLRESGGYLSGQEICERLNVSRTAVWKSMKQLKEQGYEIEAVKNRGYRLLAAPDIMTAEEIMSRIKTERIAKQVIYFPVTDSTNIQAKKHAEDKEADGLLFVADEQTKGRGRRGRSWDSPAGDNIFMSLLLKPQLKPESASMLTLLAALAVSAAVKRCTKLVPQIKWPNDIVVNKKKVCGILTEMSSEPDYIHYVVIGIGINVNAEKFPKELCETAASLYLENGGERKMNRSSLICAVMEEFERYYEEFLEKGDLEFVVEEYNEKLAGMNGEVRIIGNDGEESGISRGITKNGELIVEFKDGSRREVVSGEVSVRGIYGYV
jgi:BirA family biotin operon repressor/biotin-[acetyl-CoA-carboxylase] ligase